MTAASKPARNLDDLPDDALLRHGEVFGPIVPVAYVTGWRWIRDGKFPTPTYINGRPFHNVGKVREFLRRRAAA
jgi:hypothetical protein